MLAGSTLLPANSATCAPAALTACGARARRHHHRGLKHKDYFLTSTDVLFTLQRLQG